jgi:hypothetical protein
VAGGEPNLWFDMDAEDGGRCSEDSKISFRLRSSGRAAW